MRKWRKNSEFGIGARVTLDREQRARIKAMVRFQCFRRVGRLTISAIALVEIMLGMQGKDGRLDPAHKTLARRAGVDPSTVVRGLARLEECGFVRWVRRLIRDGNRVEQTSNAYVLMVPAFPDMHFAREALLHLKPTSCRSYAHVGSTQLTDEEARENAARQLALLGYADQASRM